MKFKCTKTMHELDHEFTDKAVSPWGGLKLIAETYKRCGLKNYISRINLFEPGSNRGYKFQDLVEGFLVSVLLGAKRLSHTGTLHHDTVIKEIFGWKKGMASQSTFSRFFQKFDLETNDQIFAPLNKWWFSQLKIDKLTIDVDSTVITRHGSQEGVDVGYNPKKPGRGSHHPIMAFVAETKMVANAWMRSGNSGASTDFKDFLAELLTIIPAERIGLLRADSGFYGESIISELEDNLLHYIIAAKMNSGLVSRIFEQRNWCPFDKGLWHTSFQYQARGWSKPRNIVVIRKDTGLNPKTGGNLLFPEYAEFEKYRYSAFVTDLNLSSELIWRLYNQRADAENRIKELKQDYGIEGFCMEEFGATEAAFRWSMVAYNLMSLFKLQVMNSKKQHMLQTIRFQCIAIGSYLVKRGRKTVLKLSAKEKRRQFLENLFTKAEILAPPFYISNA